MIKNLLIFFSVAFTNLNYSQTSPCLNEDFESSAAGHITSSTQVQGWTFYNATYTAGNSCTSDPSSLSEVSNSQIIYAPISTGYFDPNVSIQHPIHSVYGGTVLSTNDPFTSQISNQYGTSFLRLGHFNAPSRVEKVTKTLIIDSLNWHFKFAYMMVVRSGAQGTHPPACCQYPMFRVRVNSTQTNTVLSYLSRNTFLYNPSIFTSFCMTNTFDQFYLQGTNNPYVSQNMSTIFQPSFTKWREVAMDFSYFIGDTIVIDFIVNSCDDGSHNAYAYIDAQCFAGNIYANNILNTTGNFTACTNATLSTVPGYTYSWNGPNTNSISTQSVVVNSSGVYSLNIYSNQNLISTQTISVTINNPIPIQVSTTCDTICKNTSCLLSIPQNMSPYQWNSGSTTFSTLVTPSVTTFYYVQAVDSNGCYTLAYKTIVVKECTGLPDLNLDQSFKIYPNPTTDKLFLESKDLIATSVTLVDLLGKTIPIKITQDKVQEINLADFPKGIYFLKIKNENTSSTFKIINN